MGNGESSSDASYDRDSNMGSHDGGAGADVPFCTTAHRALTTVVDLRGGVLTHGLDWPGRASVFQRPPGSVCHLEVPEGGGLLLTTNLPAPTKRYALAMEICIGPSVQHAVALVQCAWPKPPLRPTVVAHLHGPVAAVLPDGLRDDHVAEAAAAVLTPAVWHRVTVEVDCRQRTIRTFIDGELSWSMRPKSSLEAAVEPISSATPAEASPPLETSSPEGEKAEAEEAAVETTGEAVGSEEAAALGRDEGSAVATDSEDEREERNVREEEEECSDDEEEEHGGRRGGRDRRRDGDEEEDPASAPFAAEFAVPATGLLLHCCVDAAYLQPLALRYFALFPDGPPDWDDWLRAHREQEQETLEQLQRNKCWSALVNVLPPPPATEGVGPAQSRDVPVWRLPQVQALYMDSAAAPALGVHVTEKEVGVVDTLLFLAALLRQTLPQAQLAVQATLERTLAVLDRSLMVTEFQNRLHWTSETDKSLVLEDALLQYARYLHWVLSGLPPGEAVFVPFADGPPSNMGDLSSLLVLKFTAEATGGFTLSVANPTVKATHHPAVTTSAAKLAQTCVHLPGIPRDRVLDPAWLAWLVVAGSSKTAHTGRGEDGFGLLYDVLLPWLDGGGREWCAAVERHAARDVGWRPPQVTPAVSFLYSILHCIWDQWETELEALEYWDLRAALDEEVLGIVLLDLRHHPVVTAADLAAIRFLGRRVAGAALDVPSALEGRPEVLARQQAVLAAIDAVEGHVGKLLGQDAFGAELRALVGTTADPALAGFPWLEALLGGTGPQAERGAVVEACRFHGLALPVFGLPRPHSLEDGLHVLAVLLETCDALDAQQRAMKHGAGLKLAAAEAVLGPLVPVPAPASKAYQVHTFWAERFPTSEAQQQCLDLLQLLAQHIASAVMSMPRSMTVYSTGAVLLSAAAAIADHVARSAPQQGPPLQCTAVLKGSAERAPFGPGVTGFARFSQFLHLDSPTLILLRGWVLDYFGDLNIPAEHQLFQWEEDSYQVYVEAAASRFFQTLLGLDPANTASRGEGSANNEFILFTKSPDWASNCGPESTGRFRMATTSNNFPDFCGLRSICFLWKLVMLAQTQYLPPVKPYSAADAKLTWTFKWTSMPPFKLHYVGGFGVERLLGNMAITDTLQTTTLTSASSYLSGIQVTTEDDVLYIRTLPHFGGSLSAQQSELLLSYLTVPYLRIPLLLSFFANTAHLHALQEPALQDLLLAALFQPGAFRSSGHQTAVTAIPCPADQLGTCYGLLMNELEHSTHVLLAATNRLLQLSLDLGQMQNPPEGIRSLVPFVLRVACAVEGVAAAVFAETPRDFAMQGRHLGALTEQLGAMRSRLWGDADALLQRWLADAAPKNVLWLAKLHTHRVLLYQSRPPASLPPAALAGYLGSVLFVTTHLDSGLSGASVDPVAFLRATAPRQPPLLAALAALPAPARNAALATAFQTATSQPPPPEWTTTAEGVFTASDGSQAVINLNILEILLAQGATMPLDPRIAQDPHVRKALGLTAAQPDALMSVVVGRFEHVLHVRVVGTGVEAERWEPTFEPIRQDTRGRAAGQLVDRKYHATPHAVWADHEQWVVDLLKAALADAIPTTLAQPIMPDRQKTTLRVLLPAAIPPTAAAVWVSVLVEGDQLCAEVCALRSHGVLHTYRPSSFGGRHCRVLVQTTDARFTLRQLTPALASLSHERPQQAVGADDGALAPRASVVLTRPALANPAAKEWFVPDVLLAGRLPDALLDRYNFWMDASAGVLRGYPLVPETATLIEAQLTPDAPADVIGPLTTVTRHPWPLPHPRPPGEPLLNLLTAAPGSLAYAVAHALVRLEQVSHVLVWAQPAGDGPEWDIELPRLRLRFRLSRPAAAGPATLRSVDFPELSLAGDEDVASLGGLLDGVPHGLVLRNEGGELFLMLPNHHLVVSAVSTEFSPVVVFNRAGAAIDPAGVGRRWERNSRTFVFVYPVHPSRAFLLTPTLASLLYLIAVRLATQHFPEAVRLIRRLNTNAPLNAEEDQILDVLGGLRDQHPDGHACRVLLSLALQYQAEWHPWDLVEELRSYTRKRAAVAYPCRLSLSEEGAALALCERGHHRLARLRAELEGSGLQPDAVRETLATRDEAADVVAGLMTAVGLRHATTVAEFRRALRALEYSTDYDDLVKMHRSITRTLQGSQCAVAAAPVVCAPSTAALEFNNFFASCDPQRDVEKIAVWHSTHDAPRQSAAVRHMVDLWKTPACAVDMRAEPAAEHKARALGFPYLYALLTGQTPFHVFDPLEIGGGEGPGEAGPDAPVVPPPVGGVAVPLAARTHAAVALHLMGGGRQPRSVPASILSALLHHPHLGPSLELPPWPVADGTPALVRVTEGGVSKDATVKRFFLDVLAALKAALAQPESSDVAPKFTPTWTLQERPVPIDRSLFATVPDPCAALSDAEVTLPAARLQSVAWPNGMAPSQAADLASLGGCLLDAIHVEQWVAPQPAPPDVPPASGGPDPPAPPLPFAIGGHPLQRSPVCGKLFRRLGDSMQLYRCAVRGRVPPAFVGLTDADLRAYAADPAGLARPLVTLDQVAQALVDLAERDLAVGLFATREMVQLVSHPERAAHPVRHRLQVYARRRCGAWPELGFAGLLAADPLALFQELNAGVTPAAVQLAMDLAALAMLTSTRYAHVLRTLREVRALRAALERVQRQGAMAEAERLELGLKRDGVARLLVTRRAYTQPAPDGGGPALRFNPRYALFEFTASLILRASQVEMVARFLDAVGGGESIVRQMIMGAGKTTVINPLLCMMLGGQGQRLIVHVVPPALVDLSRTVLVRTFSAVLRKAIFLLACGRNNLIPPTLADKLTALRCSGGVVLATDTTIKSLILRFIEAVDQGTRGTCDAQTVGRLARLVGLFRESVLIMDEVDLLLHPLKSELNYPIGKRQPLDLDKLRWELPIHVLEFVVAAVGQRPLVGPLAHTPRTKDLLQALTDRVREGFQGCALQCNPHLIVLDLHFYRTALLPLLASWTVVYLSAYVDLADADIVRFITSRPPDMAVVHSQLTTYGRKLLNLAFNWLTCILPHILQQVNRVTFGMITDVEWARAKALDATLASSCHRVAIPFRGKDAPSYGSEFAHPDITIGLTILAYLYDGLRYGSDFLQVVVELKTQYAEELGPPEERASAKRFRRWVEGGGGRIAGLGAEDAPSANVPDRPPSAPAAPASRRSTPCGAVRDPAELSPSAKALVAARRSSAEKAAKVLMPLAQLSASYRDQMETLYGLWGRQPEVIYWYLQTFTFPQFMAFQTTKLSANGQELGAPILFPVRLGFTGTPNDLMPRGLGCVYEPGSEGDIVHTLMAAGVVAVRPLAKGWTAAGLLRQVAMAQPPYSCLIDCGALITGFSNEQVARVLLRHGHMDGVVFLNEDDQPVILSRATGRISALEASGIPADRRVTFYDQTHTVGMDIRQPANALAAITLSAKTTLRDYAQAAWRLRGIGAGQRLDLLLIPEVANLVQRCTVGLELAPLKEGPFAAYGPQLVQVMAWLVLNTVQREDPQYRLLQLQNAEAVLRQGTLQALLQALGANERSVPEAQLQQWVATFKGAIDLSVPDHIPPPVPLSQIIARRLEEFPTVTADQRAVLVEVVAEVKGIEAALLAEAEDLQFGQEQQQEQQQEKHSQMAQLQEETFADLPYCQDNTGVQQWALTDLLGERPAFYPLNTFRVAGGRPLPFPHHLFVSNNYYRANLPTTRRLRNVVMVLEILREPKGHVKRLRGACDAHRPIAEPLEDATVDLFAEQLWSILDVDGSGTVPLSRLRGLVLACFGPAALPHVEDQLAGVALDGRLPRAPFLTFVRTAGYAVLDSTREFVVLSLEEAASLRKAVHLGLAEGQLLQGKVEFALRCLPSGFQVLDHTPNYWAPTKSLAFNTLAMGACLKFLNGDVYLAPPELAAVAFCLRAASVPQRQDFFARLRQVLRRPRASWNDTPLAAGLSLPSELQLLRLTAVLCAIAHRLRTIAMPPHDLLALLDSNHDGTFSDLELWNLLVTFLPRATLTPAIVPEMIAFYQGGDAASRSVGMARMAELLNPLMEVMADVQPLEEAAASHARHRLLQQLALDPADLPPTLAAAERAEAARLIEERLTRYREDLHGAWREALRGREAQAAETQQLADGSNANAEAEDTNTEHAGATVRYHFHRGTLPAPVRYTRSLEFLPAPPLHVLRVAGASELLCPVPLPCLDSGSKVNRYTVSLLFQVSAIPQRLNLLSIVDLSLVSEDVELAGAVTASLMLYPDGFIGFAPKPVEPAAKKKKTYASGEPPGRKVQPHMWNALSITVDCVESDAAVYLNGELLQHYTALPGLLEPDGPLAIPAQRAGWIGVFLNRAEAAELETPPTLLVQWLEVVGGVQPRNAIVRTQLPALWRCSCGARNSAADALCVDCGLVKGFQTAVPGRFTVHHCPMAYYTPSSGWACDARKTPGSACNLDSASHNYSRHLPRYTCRKCGFDLCLSCGAMYAVKRLRSAIPPPQNLDPEHPGVTVVVADTFDAIVRDAAGVPVLVVAWSPVFLDVGSAAAQTMQAIHFLAELADPGHADPAGDKCSVCLGRLEQPAKLPCGHVFCQSCVEALDRPRCPLCRADYHPRDVTAVATASEVPAAPPAPAVVIAKLDTELNEVDPACFSATDLQCLPCLKLFTAEYPTGLRVDINPELGPPIAQLATFLSKHTKCNLQRLMWQQYPAYCEKWRIGRLALWMAQSLAEDLPPAQWADPRMVRRFLSMHLEDPYEWQGRAMTLALGPNADPDGASEHGMLDTLATITGPTAAVALLSHSAIRAVFEEAEQVLRASLPAYPERALQTHFQARVVRSIALPEAPEAPIDDAAHRRLFARIAALLEGHVPEEAVAAELVAALEAGLAVDAAPAGVPLLHLAVGHGRAEAVRRLAAAGANLHAPMRMGRREFLPIELAANLGHVEVVAALLDAGSHFGHALKEAAVLGHPAVARLLLARGMAPGVRFGRTRAALHYAVRHRQCEVGLALLERKCPLALPCAEDLRERLLPGDSNLLHYAADLGLRHTAPLLAAISQADSELATQRNSGGKLPIDCAPDFLLTAFLAPAQQEPMQRLQHAMLRMEAVGSPDAALRASCSAQFVRAVQAVAAAGASLNVLDKRGWTPLIKAVVADDAPAVQALLDAKADVQVTSAAGHGPLMWARHLGRPACHDLLRAAGAELTPTCRAGLDRLEQAAAAAPPEDRPLLALSPAPTAASSSLRPPSAARRPSAAVAGLLARPAPEPGAAAFAMRSADKTPLRHSFYPLGYRPPAPLDTWLLDLPAPRPPTPGQSYADWYDSLGDPYDVQDPDGGMPTMATVVTAVKLFVQQSVAQGSPVKPLHIFAIYLYTLDTSIFREMNLAMREFCFKGDDRLLTFWRPYVFHLCTALDNLMQLPTVAYRGMRSAHVGAFLRGSWEVGAMQRWPQFTSVSLAVSVAKQFAEPTSEQAPVVFKIKSLSGAPIDQLSFFPHEAELLYAPGALLRTQQLYALEELSIRHGQPPPSDSSVDLNFLQISPISVEDAGARNACLVTLVELR